MGLQKVEHDWATKTCTHAITAPFGGVEAASLTMVISIKKNKIYDITWTCPLAKGKKKTVNIYTVSKHVLGVAHNSEMLWQQCIFLIYSINKI